MQGQRICADLFLYKGNALGFQEKIKENRDPPKQVSAWGDAPITLLLRYVSIKVFHCKLSTNPVFRNRYRLGAALWPFPYRYTPDSVR